MKATTLLPPMAAMLSMVSASLAGDFVLVEGGQSRAQIVLARDQTAPPVQFAARELQRYIKAMSGALLPIAAEAAVGPAIVISCDRQSQTANPRQQLSPARDDRYVLEVSQDRITLHGATPPAALFAVYDLLERLGCGWAVPGDDTVPSRSTLSIGELKVDTTPEYSYRAMLDYPLESIPQSIANIDWLAKNRMNWVHPCENAMGEPKKWFKWREKVVPEIQKRGLHVHFGGHTMHTWLPPENFKEHPEWFAYQDGARKVPALCVTNMEMTKELIRNLQHFLDRCSEVEVVDLWHPDSDSVCRCAVCTKGTVPAAAKGTTSTPPDSIRSAYIISYIEFINRVAEALSNSHPKVMLSPLIYGTVEYAMPDHTPTPLDNVLVGLAHIGRDSYFPLAGDPKSTINYRYLGNDLTWMAKTRQTYIYEYYNCWWDPFIYPGERVIVQDLQILRELGATGSSSDMYGYSPCNMYVAARALWSPQISWTAAVRDFHMRHYGDAGPEMADNWLKLEEGIYGKAGYQTGSASAKEESKRAPCGVYLNKMRPQQIALLESLITRTRDPQVKDRLQRALLPWKKWNGEPRLWAYPRFQ
jgi:Domain of unknown function (DUF4838)